MAKVTVTDFCDCGNDLKFDIYTINLSGPDEEMSISSLEEVTFECKSCGKRYGVCIEVLDLENF